ncbi:MAG: hypothetical protein H0W02_08205 [Ktedonobacteraceae bacterium]|nr:hypothetical protein [Ktedonobacteraceae bacterium]
MSEQLNIILVPHTHWDREWYQTFQQFRIRLVRTIDKLLDILDHEPGFSYFMLDGQTIVLDDYLEVEPEQEERLKKHTRAGRILVGPWYLQPDEFLVSGESLIRNLQIGLKRAAEFGEPMRVGYLPDCFGHIAQMPQILQGAGIDTAVFWRGVGAEARESEFYWAAPDGTQVLVIYLPDGYGNARMMPLTPEDFATRVELLTIPLLAKATTNTVLFMNGSDHLEAQAGLPATIKAANALLAHIDPRHEQILKRFAHASQNGKPHYSGIHLQIGTLPQYIAAIRAHNEQPGEAPFRTLSGEMRDSQYAHLLPSVLSTRMWIKQQNAVTEHLLEHWVEPLAAWAWQLGAAYPQGLVRLAWRYLLQNHPHDSICGCSVDQVHRENSVRFAQSQQIGETVVTQALLSLARETHTIGPFEAPHMRYQPVPIVVFNVAPGPYTTAVLTGVEIPGSLRNAVIVDERGEQMLYHLVSQQQRELGTRRILRNMLAAVVALSDIKSAGQLIGMAHDIIMTTLGQPDDPREITHIHVEATQEPGVERVEMMIAPRGRVNIDEQALFTAEQQLLALLQREDIHTLEVAVVDQAQEVIDFVASDLPSHGLKTFWLYPHGLKGETRPTPVSSLVCQPHSIENEYYRVEANPDDGTLTLRDKQTGAIFTGLNRFVDGGDVGDLYTYCPPAQETLVSAPLDPPRIELVNAGPVRAVLRVSGRWALPAACAPTRDARGAETEICIISSDISLTPGARRVDIHTVVDNKVKDHRLRVLFPVPYTVEHAAAEGTFEVRTRPISVPRPANVSEWAEEPVNVFPQKRFVDVSNGERGLGVLNRGLPEYEILRNGTSVAVGQVVIAVTLLRCIDWLSRGDLSTRQGHAGPMEYTPEGQCLGRQEFDYALVSHRGDWATEEALVLREAQAFNLPVRAVVTEQHAGRLPTRTALVEVEPRALVVSAIKRSNAGDGVIVRVYNPLGHAVEASIRPGLVCSKAFVTNLLEEPQEQLEWSEEEDAGEVVTREGTGETTTREGAGKRRPYTKSVQVGIRAGEITTILLQ